MTDLVTCPVCRGGPIVHRSEQRIVQGMHKGILSGVERRAAETGILCESCGAAWPVRKFRAAWEAAGRPIR